MSGGAWGRDEGSNVLDGLQRAVHFEHLTDGNDTLGSVLPVTIFIESTELIARQAVQRRVKRTRQGQLAEGHA